MKHDKETREKLLASARQEFLEKGYMQASLRNICRNAGVTTGALYFFFEDKEDLFANLVQEPLLKLYQMMSEHYQGEAANPPEILHSLDDFGDDLEMAKQIIYFMYQYYEEFQLLLVKSQGSSFEHCADQFVTVSEQHYRAMADMFTTKLGKERLDDYLIHWIAHIQIDIFVHVLTHDPSAEKAWEHAEPVISYIMAGWKGILF